MAKLKDQDTTDANDANDSQDPGDSVKTNEAHELIQDNVERHDSVSEPAPSGNGFKLVFTSKKFRIALPILAAVGALVLVSVKPLQYSLLNLVSKSSVEFVVVDDETLAAAQSTTVSIGNLRAETDKNGRAVLRGVPYGSNEYRVTKELYLTKTNKVEVALGTNLIGPVKIHSDGVPLVIKVNNSLNMASIKDFQASVEGSKISARSNKMGEAVLKLPTRDKGSIKVIIDAKGFNKAKYETTIADAVSRKSAAINLTPEGRHYFLSNRAGKIDIYSANLDGSDQQKIIAGSDADDTQTVLSISLDGQRGALISKRDNQKGPNGQVIPALYSIDFAQKTIKRIDEGAPSFGIVGWADSTKLAYTVNYNDYNRSDNAKLKTADIVSGQLNTLYTQKGYNNPLFYPEDPGHAYFIQSDPAIESYGIISVDLATKKAQRLHETPSYEIFHGRPYYLDFIVDNSSFGLSMKDQTVQSITTIKRAQNQYYKSPNAQKMAWIENRDGKGTIIIGDSNGDNGTAVGKGVSAASIIRWVSDDYLVLHAIDQGGSADFVLDVGSGMNTKISDTFAPQAFGHG